jgi:hypothetical protein
MGPHHAENHHQNMYTICNGRTFETDMFVTHTHNHIHVGADDPCRACEVATEFTKELPISCCTRGRNIEGSSLFLCYAMLTGKQLSLF